MASTNTNPAVSPDPTSYPYAKYEIDPEGDLFVRVIELDYRAPRDSSGQRPIKKEGLMRVSRQVLIDNSDPFRVMLSGGFAEASQSVVTLGDESVFAAELWFRVLHGNLNEDCFLLYEYSNEDDEDEPEIHYVDLWNAIEFGRTWLIHLDKLNDWFEGYWARLDKPNLKMDEMRQLLFPAGEFDHAEAFAYLSKRIAHEGVGHFEEFNPTRHRHLHLDKLVVQQVNAARGSMRREIIKGLFKVFDHFCSTNCAARHKSISAYIDALRMTGIWPLEDLPKKSNQKIIESHGFVNFKAKIPDGACNSCKGRLRGTHLPKIGEAVKQYWQGSCLDCMDSSNPKTGDSDLDYWYHNLLFDWDHGCRIMHGRSTWYFSYMGQKSKMDAFHEEQQERKRERRRNNNAAASEASWDPSTDLSTDSSLD